MGIWDKHRKQDIESGIKTARIKSLAAEATISGLKLQYIRYYEMEIGLAKGSEVLIDYDSGTEKAIYLGAESTGYAVWVNLRLFTKKDKPCKALSRDDYTVMSFMHK